MAGYIRRSNATVMHRILITLYLSSPLWMLAQTCDRTTLPPPGPDGYISHLAVHADASYSLMTIPGALQGDVVIHHFAASGTPLWNKRIMTLDPMVFLDQGALEPTPDGGLVAYGSRANMVTGTANSYAVKLDPLGTIEWARMYMVPDTSVYIAHRIEQIEVFPGGGYLVLSSGDWPVITKLDDQGVPLWSKRYDDPNGNYGSRYGLGMHIRSNGEIFFFESNPEMPASVSDLVVSRLDPNGMPLWTKRFDLAEELEARGLIELSNGNLAIYGESGFVGQPQFVAVVDTGSGLEALKTFDTQGRSTGLYEAANGDLIMSSISNFGIGAMVLRMGSDLTPIEAWSAPDSAEQSLIPARVDDTLRVLLQPLPWFGTGTLPELVKATAPWDLGCAMTATTLPGSIDRTATLSDSITVSQDSLKTWTMALLTAVPNVCDVVSTISSGPARPGFWVTHYALATNAGDVMTGPLEVTIDVDTALTIQGAWPTPTSIAGDQVIWSNIPPLAGLSGASFVVSASLPPDPGLLGMQLVSQIHVEQDTTEVGISNNTASVATTVTGSYDPNDKLVFPKDFYHITGDSILDYTIRFQNTGTDTAFNIVVIDTLPPDVDVLTFQAGAASHPYTYSLTGEGLLTFTFSNILLADSNTNEPLSHGLVNFRIKPIQPIYLGQSISNEADIYFDFNPPVRTPPATVVVTDFMAVKPPAPTNELKLYPVPVRDVLTVEVPKGFLPRNAIITTSDGRTVWSSGVMNAKERLNIPVQKLATGAYTLTLLSVHGERSQARFVKE